MKKILLFGLVAFLTPACPHNPPPNPEPVPPPTGPATCEEACKHLVYLKCIGSGPTPEGASCVEVCQNLVDSNVVVNLDCRVRAASCEAIDRCEISQ